MELSNEIVLRPRFKFEVETNNEKLLKGFEETKKTQSDFVVSRIDDHVFIKFPKHNQHFWSPQLHLEINEDHDKKDKSMIYGLFGPNPTVWTMFMFFHFIVGSLFIGSSIWAYVNWSLESNYAIQIFLAILMILIWTALYISGCMGKKAGMEQMHELHHFMRDTLHSKYIHSIS
jgi:hypothetical protein